jgi:predicted dehydrogenase
VADVRLGLIGTGYWARAIHGASAAQHPSVQFVGVWGRNGQRAAELAHQFGVKAYSEADALIEDVDALTFAVPPAVQADIAVRAAQRGRHLLLEKPIATSADDARRVEDAVADADVASVVFFTQRFVPQTRAWLERVAEQGGWLWGRAETSANIFVEGGPFAGSEWRREYGALWDIAPHALSLLCPVLGEVRAVVAGRGHADQVHLILQHADGRSSSIAVSLTAPSAAAGRTFYFDGEYGRQALPTASLDDAEVIAAHGAALDALIEQQTSSKRGHPCDVHFGARVVEVLAAAQQSLESGCWVTLEPAPARA